MKFKLLIPLFAGALVAFASPTQAKQETRAELVVFKNERLQSRSYWTMNRCLERKNLTTRLYNIKTPNTAFCLKFTVDDSTYTLYLTGPESNIWTFRASGLSACRRVGNRVKTKLIANTQLTNWKFMCEKD